MKRVLVKSARGNPSNPSICPLKSVIMMYCSQVKALVRTTRMQMNFPETLPGSLLESFLLWTNKVAGLRQSCK